MAKKARATGLPALSLLDIGSLEPEDVDSSRWADQLQITLDYCYNEELPDRLVKTSFDGIDLSDAWLHAIVFSGLRGEKRNTRCWPVVFTQKAIRVAYPIVSL